MKPSVSNCWLCTDLFVEGTKYIQFWHWNSDCFFKYLHVLECFSNHIKQPLRLMMNSYSITLTFLSSPKSLSAPDIFASEFMVSSALRKFYFLWQEKLALFSSSSQCLAGAHSSGELSSCTYLLNTQPPVFPSISWQGR